MNKNYLLLITLLTSACLSSQVPVMLSIAGKDSVCSTPSSFEFTATASGSPNNYNWSVVPSAGVFLSSYTNSKTKITFPNNGYNYTVYCSATNNYGTGQPMSKMVSVYTTPQVSFSGGSNNFCQGSSTFLSASPTIGASSTISYTWSPGSTLSSTTGANVYATPQSSTTYTVLYQMFTCTNVGYISLNVIPSPTISVSSSTAMVCPGETATLTIKGNATKYYVNNNLTPLTFTVAPTSSTTYTILGQGSNGCFTELSFTQNVAICMGIQKWNQLAGNSIIAYPNPSANSFTLRSAINESVNIVDQLGRTIQKIDLTADKERNVTSLKPGVYIVVSQTSSIRVIITE